jgi:hypothetical protein
LVSRESQHQTPRAEAGTCISFEHGTVTIFFDDNSAATSW